MNYALGKHNNVCNWMDLIPEYSQPYNYFTIEMHIISFFSNLVVIHQKSHITLGKKWYVCFKYQLL